MPLFYPHKQTGIIFIVCTICVLGTIWYVKRGDANIQKTSEIVYNKQNTNVTPIGSIFASTTEWQKQFFASPNTNDTKTSLANTQNTKEPETVTGLFGKKFFEQYMLLKQNDLTEDPTAIKAVIDKNMSDLVSTAPQAQTYDIRNVLTTQNSEVVDDRVYANIVGEILSSYLPRKDAAIIATEALEKNDPSMIKEVESISSSYSVMLKKLLATPAPKTLSTNHLNLINAVSAMVFVSQGMSKVFSDPIQSMIALAVYEKSFASLQNALLDLKYNFSQKSINFSKDEPGIIFTLIN